MKKKIIRYFLNNRGNVWVACFGNKMNIVISGSGGADESMKIWDLKTGILLKKS